MAPHSGAKRGLATFRVPKRSFDTLSRALAHELASQVAVPEPVVAPVRKDSCNNRASALSSAKIASACARLFLGQDTRQKPCFVFPCLTGIGVKTRTEPNPNLRRLSVPRLWRCIFSA